MRKDFKYFYLFDIILAKDTKDTKGVKENITIQSL